MLVGYERTRPECGLKVALFVDRGNVDVTGLAVYTLG